MSKPSHAALVRALRVAFTREELAAIEVRLLVARGEPRMAKLMDAVSDALDGRR